MKKSYEIILGPLAQKSFKKLPKNVRNQILDKIEYYENSGQPLSFAKKLQGFENQYRWRIGNYRTIFTKNKKGELVLLVIIKIGHRREVYE